MYITEIISSGLSLLAISLTIIVYFKHDKRLKKQEEKINAYLLKKIETEDSENKKAQIRGNIVKGKKGSRILKIFNSGKSIARNIRVEYLGDMQNIISWNEHFPYELLNPQDNTEIYLSISEGTKIMNIKYIWNDDFQNDNEFTQVLTL